jgi:hypothetical protein
VTADAQARTSRSRLLSLPRFGPAKDPQPPTAEPQAKPKPAKDTRIVALRRFAMSITVLNIVGLTVLGFEQAYATPLVAVLTGYIVELVLETVEARVQRRPARYAGSVPAMVDFLLPAHITGLACSMLLYANSDLFPVVFAVTVAVGSKYVIRVTVNGRTRHALNPSNFGIVVTLLLFHWVGIAPPYEFTERVGEPFSWLIPVAILAAGTMLNGKLTRKMPLILAWVGGFALQAVIRTSIEHTAMLSALLVMSGTAFVLFTNYMITDPGTTPTRPWRQVMFGVATAAAYGLLVYLHVVFGLFFALVIVCAARALGLAAQSQWRQLPRRAKASAGPGTAPPVPAPPVPAPPARARARSPLGRAVMLRSADDTGGVGDG